MKLEKRNCPEKRVFCVDLCGEMDSLDFARGKSSPTRLDLVKSALRLFVYTKQKINQDHEFALVLLTEKANWFLDLTTDLELFCKKLTAIQTQGEWSGFDLASLFDLMRVKFPEILSTQNISATHYTYRAIFLYSRSDTIPSFPSQQTKMCQQVLDSPIFFFDILYLHSKPGRDNKPQDVYDFITELEGKDHNPYFFENSTSSRKFLAHMSHLLAHPLQRPPEYKTSLTGINSTE